MKTPFFFDGELHDYHREDPRNFDFPKYGDYVAEEQQSYDMSIQGSRDIAEKVRDVIAAHQKAIVLPTAVDPAPGIEHHV